MSDDDTTLDYALPYGRRVPTSYDAEAAASLIGAEAEYIAANGGKSFLSTGEVVALKDVIGAWAEQFRVRTGRDGQGE
jgi:phosphopantothenate synthetase